MRGDEDLLALIGRCADPALLHAEAASDGGLVPAGAGAPPPLPASDRRHDRIVAVGAALTGITLIAGSLLAVAGAIDTIAAGASLGIAALIVGVVLVATHWGWVHFAELGATRLDDERTRAAESRRAAWLAELAPYPRVTVRTRVGDDGGIVIERIVHEPVPVGSDRFGFTRTVTLSERHSGEESGVAVTERAEQLRHDAEAETALHRERYEAAAAALDDAALGAADDAERLAVVRAASQALSDQINARLRERE